MVHICLKDGSKMRFLADGIDFAQRYLKERGPEHFFNLGMLSWHKQAEVLLAMATILIIDDEASIRLLLRSVLEAAGYEVTEASNGRQGLELYRHRPTDLVITDICMPELDGLEVLLALTREFIHVKVIVMSGVREQESALRVAKLLRARQTIQKPFTIPPLLDAVRYEVDH